MRRNLLAEGDVVRICGDAPEINVLAVHCFEHLRERKNRSQNRIVQADDLIVGGKLAPPD